MGGLLFAASLFAACVCVVCTHLVTLAVRECNQTLRTLQSFSARLTALEHELGAISGSLHKVRQKVYSLKPEKQESEIARNDALLPGNVGGACGVAIGAVIPCEYYLEAQTKGPGSLAAQHDCPYCNAKREERAAARAKVGLRPLSRTKADA